MDKKKNKLQLLLLDLGLEGLDMGFETLDRIAQLNHITNYNSVGGPVFVNKVAVCRKTSQNSTSQKTNKTKTTTKKNEAVSSHPMGYIY
jgi:CheY-like chemotaxis protein